MSKRGEAYNLLAWWAVLILLAMIGVASSCQAGWEDVVESRKNSILIVINPQNGGAGTGVLVAQNRIVTAHHVAEGVTSVVLLGVPGHTKPILASVVKADAEHDLALLVPDEMLVGASTIGDDPKLGEELVLISFVDYGKNRPEMNLTVFVGNVMAKNVSLLSVGAGVVSLRKNMDYLQAPGVPGISGGGLFNKDGKLAGLGSSYNERGHTGFIPAKYIRKLLKGGDDVD